MLTIKTTDRQILVSKDGKEFEGLPKNSLRYKPTCDQLNFFLGNSPNVFLREYWSDGITINDIIVTRENVNEALDPLFTDPDINRSGGGNSEMQYEANIQIKSVNTEK